MQFFSLRTFMVLLGLSTVMGAAFAEGETHGDTLALIKERGQLKCGVSQGLPGFSNPDDKGNWEGIDVDFCRAVAAATLGNKDKVEFIPLSAKERFTALQSGEIDLLSRNTTWTFSRDTSLGLDFSGTLYYDGQGFMVRKNLGVKSVKDLDGAVICTNTGTTTELNVADYFRSNNLDYKIVSFEKTDEVVAAYEAGRCDVYTTDASGLAAQRLKLSNEAEHFILPEIISKEPLGPVVRQGDDQWGNIVRWTLFALVNAEELGVTSKNLSKMKSSNNPGIQRLLGKSGQYGKLIGLEDDWSMNIIAQVGNYGEMFEKNLGGQSRLGIKRGLNALWSQGGILYAPPIR